MTVTRFTERSEGPSDRLSDFVSHLRDNGFQVGMPETSLSLCGLSALNLTEIETVRMGLKAICCGDSDQFNRFDDLFDAYWRRRGSIRTEQRQMAKAPSSPAEHPALKAWADGAESDSTGTAYEADTANQDGDDEESREATGKLIASSRQSLEKTDLRKIVTPADLAEAEKIAEVFARQIRYRRSRRRKAAKRGAVLDLRRIIRSSLSSGGDPVRLHKKQRKTKPSHLVVLLDASGSMTSYARVFLSFLKGLISVDQRADAYLFHTRLIRISDALRDKDSLRAVNRLSLMAEGFGSGTRIGHSLALFNAGYASRMVSGRSTILLISDGYDTDPPEQIADALKRLKRRGCRIVWLNPLQSWQEHEVITRGIEAARPVLDLLSPAANLNDLARLGQELSH